MKRPGKFQRAGAALAAAVLILTTAGCGETAVHEELDSGAENKTVIRIAWWGNEERQEVTTRLLELYSELHPQIVFETQSYIWEDYFDILSWEAAQGDLPDLIQMDYQYITTYTENGSLADLRPFVEDGTIRTEDIDEAILDSGMVDGRLSGIVLGTALLSMICNPAVFEEAGLPLPDEDWTWDDFADICIQIKGKTGKYGAAMTPILDLNLFHYWVRQHGEELFSSDGRLLGYGDDAVYVGYVELFKELMECDAVPDSDSWAAISVRGQEQLPVVTGGCGMTQEWNNFPVRMSYVNDGLKLITPPLLGVDRGGIGGNDSMENAGRETDQANEAAGQGDIQPGEAAGRGDARPGEAAGRGDVRSDEAAGQGAIQSGESAGRDSSPGLWLKPGMFFSVAETSDVKKECAQFIDWFINSQEANEILRGERGIPVSEKVLQSLSGDETLTEVQREMFRFSREAISLCGDTPPPEPAGIDGLNTAFAETANAYFYGAISAEEAAAEFRRRANEILQFNRQEP